MADVDLINGSLVNLINNYDSDHNKVSLKNLLDSLHFTSNECFGQKHYFDNPSYYFSMALHSVELVSLLIETYNYDLNVISVYGGLEYLCRAVINGNYDMCELLLRHISDINRPFRDIRMVWPANDPRIDQDMYILNEAMNVVPQNQDIIELLEMNGAVIKLV